MKTISRSLLAAVLLPGACLFNSCATLFTGKTTPIVLVNCPSDVKVYEGGQQLSIERVQSQVKAQGTDATVTYFASGVKIDKKQKQHTITFESNGVKKDHVVKMKADGGIIFLDVIFTGPIGIIVDASTKKWRKAKNRHIDVAAILNDKKPMSQAKLKKTVRRNARG